MTTVRTCFGVSAVLRGRTAAHELFRFLPEHQWIDVPVVLLLLVLCDSLD